MDVPTAKESLLPAEIILLELAKKGEKVPAIRLAVQNTTEQVRKLSQFRLHISEWGNLIRQKHPTMVWSSLTAELKSLVKRPGTDFDLVPWAALFLEIFRGNGLYAHHDQQHAIANNGEPKPREHKPGYLVDNDYVATCVKELWPHYAKMGWEKLFNIDDLYFIGFTREAYINYYLKNSGRYFGKTRFIDDIRAMHEAPKSYYWIDEGLKRQKTGTFSVRSTKQTLQSLTAIYEQSQCSRALLNTN